MISHDLATDALITGKRRREFKAVKLQDKLYY
jgi:hypothetical protein